jgi:hypothetical protein
MTAGWPMSAVLRRRYRRLLLAYPRAYRRRHGPEILTTLMEAAGPGRERPTAAEARDVVAGGLRQRFRLPVGRLMMLAALLTALTLGGLGAAVGSAIGWSTAQRPPTDAAVGELTDLAMGGPNRHDTQHQPEALGLRSQTTATVAGFTTAWSPTQARSRLEAAGWRVDPVETVQTEATTVDTNTTIPMGTNNIVADRDGITLDLSIMAYRVNPSDQHETSYGLLMAMPSEPASVLPVTLAGGLLGLLAGWLLAGRTGYRLRRTGTWQRAPINVLAVAAMLLLAPSTLDAWYLAVRAAAVAAGPELVGGDRLRAPSAYTAYIHDVSPSSFAVAGLMLGVIVVGLSIAVRPRPARIHLLGKPGQ